MSEYIGSKCIVCDKTFTKDDEIVVCPDCGTPYHRECYLIEGKCINTVLHEKNQSWNSVNKVETEDVSEGIKCSKCGEINPSTGLFCLKCGTPLVKSEQSNPYTQGNPFQQGNQPPFNNMGMNFSGNIERFTDDSEIDGIKLKEYNQYLSKSQYFFIPQFIKFSKLNKKFAINIPAMFFPEFYFFYRKMNVYGILFFILRLFITIPTLISSAVDGYLSNYINVNISTSSLNNLLMVGTFLNYAILFCSAVFSTWLYFEKAKKDINKINSEDITESEKEIKIKQKGGVSKHYLSVSILMYYLIIIVSFIILNKI